jgi:hypothetical protein
MLVVAMLIAMFLARFLALLLAPSFVVFFVACRMVRFNCNPSVATRCDDAESD